MVTEDKLLQFLKASLPIEVTLLGMVTDVKLVQSSKASLPIEVTFHKIFSIVTVWGITISPV